MKKVFGLLVILLLTIPAFSQENITDEVVPLLKEHSYDSATRLVNSYLNAHPNSVDGFVMKGNIIFYRYTHSIPSIALNGNQDESIYEDNMGSISENPIIIPGDTADEITSIFMKALDIDKTRSDVYMGICYVYSVSLQSEKLISFLPKVKENVPMDSSGAYTLADYARNMEERNDFDNGIKVYEKIADMFPGQSGILSDIAAEFYRHGDLEKAKAFADKAFAKPNIDAQSCGNIFFIYGVLEDYTDAERVIKKRSELVNNKAYLIYDGLLALNDGKDNKAIFKQFLSSDTSKGLGYQLANFILSKQFDKSMLSYNTLIALDMNDAYKILIHKYYKKISPDFHPSFNYAEALTYNNRYNEAAKAFADIKTDTITAHEKESLFFYSAWAYYKTGNFTKANELWEQLLKSDNFYRKSAAAYFLGKYYSDKKDSKKADEYFSLVSDDPSKSKYAAYCSGMLSKK